MYIFSEGKKILDVTAGSTSFAVLGWNNELVNKAIKDQLKKFSHVDFKSWTDPNLDKLSKTYVLLTNAPRPNKTVINFLNKMGLPKFCSQNVYTSGEASLKYINKHYKFSKFFHLGPPRDFDLFMSFESNKSKEIDTADFNCLPTIRT